jgi:hypothetical protein
MRFIGNVEKDAQVRAVASGALSNGDAVVVNSNGTVGVVDPNAASVPQSIGTPVEYDSGTTYYERAAFDTANNKVVITYRDVNNSNYSTVIVGDVSGSSITFGTPVIIVSFEPAGPMPVVYDSSNEKIVIFYNNTSYQPTATVATVSGTSISLGSAVAFDTSVFIYNQASAAYDSVNGKVVTAYRRNGSDSSAIVGTVSGTSISFGSPSSFYSGSANDSAMGYDSSAGKVVIAFKEGNSGLGVLTGTVSGTSISFGSRTTITSNVATACGVNYVSNANKTVVTYTDAEATDRGKAVVGTISGTSISFGTIVTFGDANTFASVATPVASNTVSIAYPDRDNSNYGTFIVGTVSGTSISFNTKTAFNSANSNNFWGSAYDSNSKRAVFAYNDGSGKGVVAQPAHSGSNSESFIGFANGAYANAASAVINTTCSVDRNQSGLTAGQTYYVQTDGSLGTTADDPSVVAGTAISSTEIIVRG